MPNMLAKISDRLARVLADNAGNRLTHELIVGIGAMIEEEVHEAQAAITPRVSQWGPRPPESWDNYVFRHVYLEHYLSALTDLHRMQWDEVGHEGERLNPDYDRVIAAERSRGFLQFVIVHVPTNKFVGNCGAYTSFSTHTRKLVANEDTLYIVPQHRRGLLASKFLGYIEQQLKAIGVTELQVSTKERAARVGLLLQRRGFVLEAREYTKRIGD